MKVVFISSMTPSGHYSQYICRGLRKQKNTDLIVYAGLHEMHKVDNKSYGTVKYVWHKSPRFVLDILKALETDRPDIVHIQQEFNMYGGTMTAMLLPLLILMIRIAGYKVVVTIHAAVWKKQINDEFIHMFHKNPRIIRPWMLVVFFGLIYKWASVAANTTFIHTKRKQKILTTDYGINPNNLTFMPIVIPDKKRARGKTEKYFFYFGYMVRRKGLNYALEGFRDFVASHPKTPYKLIMAGGVIPGQEKAYDEIKEFITQNALEKHVEMKGFIEESVQDKLYAHAYAVVIPARVTMGSSGPLFHAMSYGKCVIATREGYFREDIKHLKTGILTENSRWKRAFEYAATHTKQVKTIEENVCIKAATQSPERVAAKYIQVYNSL